MNKVIVVFLLIILGSVVGYLIDKRLDNDLSTQLNAQRDTVSMWKDSISIKDSVISHSLARDSTRRVQYTADSLGWENDRGIERRMQRTETRNFQAVLDSLKALGDTVVTDLVEEIQASQREIVRSIRIEVQVLESRVRGLEGIRQGQEITIQELLARDLQKDAIISALESMSTTLERKVKWQKIEIWGTRGTTLAALTYMVLRG